MNTQNATPELLNVFRNLPAAFKNSVSAGTAIITPLYYFGIIAGSEFLTYAATKLYVALEIGGTDAGASSSTTIPYINLYNEANTIMGGIKNGNAFWQATAAAVHYYVTYNELKNVYFGRILQSSAVTYMKFNGYKIIIP